MSRELTGVEALLLGAVTVAALASWASLITATLEVHSLASVGLLTAVASTAILLVALRTGRPSLQIDWREIAAFAGLGLFSLALFLPGFPYAAADKDPGVYVIHGVEIAQTGSLTTPDDVYAVRDQVPMQKNFGGRFPGLWIYPGEDVVRPQFYHLYPAALATSYDVAGSAGIFHFNPVVAALSVLVITAAVRRPFGWPAAAATGALLATNMMQVWQAKSPTTEILTQLFVGAALLAVVIALDTGWRPAAGLAGLFTTLTFLARPDGVLLVVLAVVGLAALVAFRRWDGRGWWFLGGLALPFPHAGYQAWWLNDVYSDANDLPSLALVAAGAVAAFAGAALWRYALGPLVGRAAPRLLADRDPWRLGAFVLVTVAALGLAVGYARPELWGDDVVVLDDGSLLRRWNERNLLRLTWFFTYPGIALMWLGLAVVAFRDRVLTRWVIWVPGALLLPLYVYEAKVASRLMWWTRRFVPVVIVGMVMLVAIALAWMWDRSTRLRVAAVALVLFLVGTNLYQDRHLVNHREMGGSWATIEAIADLGDPDTIYLWQKPNGIFDAGRILGGPLWFIHDRTSTLLPSDPTIADIDAYATAFADREILVLSSQPSPPPGLPLERFELVDTVQTRFPFWTESDRALPQGPNHGMLFIRVWAWRYLT